MQDKARLSGTVLMLRTDAVDDGSVGDGVSVHQIWARWMYCTPYQFLEALDVLGSGRQLTGRTKTYNFFNSVKI